MEDQATSRPSVDSSTARNLATSLYGIEVVSIHELKSHSDRNFHIVTQKSESALDAQDDITGKGSMEGMIYVTYHISST